MRIDKDTPIEVIREKLVDGMEVVLNLCGQTTSNVIEVLDGCCAAVLKDGKFPLFLCSAYIDGVGEEWVWNDNWYIDLPEVDESIAIQTPAELLKVEATKLEEAIKCALGEFSDKTGVVVSSADWNVKEMYNSHGAMTACVYLDVRSSLEWRGAL